MNIMMVNPDGGAFKYIIHGMALAFTGIGHEVKHWNGNLEAWDEFKPDIYIGSSGWPQSIPKGKTKVALHVNPYGSTRLRPVDGGPDINEPPRSIEWVAAQNPEFVFGYGLGADINQYWDLWINKCGIPALGIPTAGDHFSFRKVPPHATYRCELAFIGGYWKYKAVNIERYLEPARKKFKTFIFGWGGWNNRSRGSISDSEAHILFSSAKIGPCIHEPHTAIYGIDIPERVFKVPLCGALAISDPSASLYNYFPQDIMPMARNPQEYLGLIDHYLTHDEERTQMAEAQRRHVLKHHTYLHRIKTIFSGFGMIDECIKIQKAIDRL